jgi:hypothetical protein
VSAERIHLAAWACLQLLAAGCYEMHPGVPAPDAASPGGAASAGSHARGDASAGSAGARAADGGGSPGSAGNTSTKLDGGSADAAMRDAAAPTPIASTEPNLRVALLGDQSMSSGARAVLQLVKARGAALVIHAGDLSYGAAPADWEAMIDDELGSEFPYFAAVGNHDLPDWSGALGFQARLAARLARTPGAACRGDLGVNSRCSYRGLVFVLSGVGTLGVDHEVFLDEALATHEAFRLCIWHKNQHDMQTEAKIDEVGWAAYQVCQAHGAPIITGHAHTYARTYALATVGDQLMNHGMLGQPDVLELGPGRTVVFVSGLGGASIRSWNGEDSPWWATIYTRSHQRQDAVVTGALTSIEFGVLFVDFHVDGDPRKARGEFVTTSGAVVDSFTLISTP